MRYALAVVIFAVPCTGALAQSADNAFAAYRAFPCQSFVTDPKGKPELAAADAVHEYASAYDGFETYVSYCTTVEQVRAECRLDPRYTVGDAVDRLFAKKRNGIPLPMKRACGA